MIYHTITPPPGSPLATIYLDFGLLQFANVGSRDLVIRVMCAYTDFTRLCSDISAGKTVRLESSRYTSAVCGSPTFDETSPATNNYVTEITKPLTVRIYDKYTDPKVVIRFGFKNGFKVNIAVNIEVIDIDTTDETCFDDMYQQGRKLIKVVLSEFVP